MASDWLFSLDFLRRLSPDANIAERPNQKWVTDVTEFSLFGEKLYLSPIPDLCSEDLVSYTISDRPVLGVVTTMLEKVFETIPDGTELILHSNQGWQYLDY